jgi:uncharacterized protein YndB with AHSA1/START domain
MSATTDPITLRFEVRCSPERAFATWTTDMSLWWPRDHTVSGDDGAEVHFEPGIGGRLFERSAGGEIDWGRVVAWEPPRRVVYRWHLGFTEDEATEVEVTFTAQAGGGVTVVELVHRGWDELVPEAAAVRRDRNQAGWAGVVPLYQHACSSRRT